MTVRPIVFLFLRYPVPGQVKTRLARGSSPEEAANLYRVMAEMIVEQVSTRAGHEYDLCLYYTPASDSERIHNWLFPYTIPAGVQFEPQPEGTLADRLEHAGRLAARSGAPAMVFIGSDCIDIGSQDLAEALKKLEHSPAFLAPTEDGGFWLLALRHWQEGMFRDVTYSNEHTADQMAARLNAFGLQVEWGELRVDIDEIDDLRLQSKAIRAQLLVRAKRAEGPMPAETYNLSG